MGKNRDDNPVRVDFPKRDQNKRQKTHRAILWLADFRLAYATFTAEVLLKYC